MHLSDLRIFVEPQQGATYGQQLAVARTAESLGFGAFFRSDHYLRMGAVSGLPGPTDAWVTLAGLARETSTIRLGTLVSSATFRYPGPLAISVAQVDEMSGGRVELGLGAGWYEAEHHAYAIPFPPVGERFDRLEEQLQIISGMWATPEGATFEHRGRHYEVLGSPALPKPVQRPGPPIIVGGRGPKRTPALAARFGAEANASFASVDEFVRHRERVSAACDAIGRDPSSVVFSVAQIVAIGTNEQEFSRRAQRIGREPSELREHGVCGVVDDAIAKLNTWRDAGASRIYLQVLDLDDLDHLHLIATDVANR